MAGIQPKMVSMTTAKEVLVEPTLILMSSVVTALQSLAHRPLSLHLLAQNTLTNYKLNDLFYYLSKVLSTMPYVLLFADTHSWVCFSIGSQHSSHINSRDYLSFHFRKREREKKKTEKKKEEKKEKKKEEQDISITP